MCNEGPGYAHYHFARNEWDSDQAHWFSFVTRFAEANHTHYDMNTFLFTAFGEPFATHADGKETIVSGARRARQGLDPLATTGALTAPLK